MLAIVVQQPYADMIASGEKTIENRAWKTRHRGSLLIVAGKGTRYLSRDDLSGFRTGEAVAIVTVTDCVPLHDAPLSPHAEGPYCWLLDNPRPLLSNQKIRGMPGIFDVDRSNVP